MGMKTSDADSTKWPTFNKLASVFRAVSLDVSFTRDGRDQLDGVLAYGKNSDVRRACASIGLDIVRVSPVLSYLKDAGYGADYYHGAISNLPSEDHASVHFRTETIARLVAIM